MLTIWSLVSLPFLNPACTSRSSQFIYCWSLAWRILSITLLAGSVQFIVSDSLRPHELQHARPLYPSPTPGIYPNSCPSSQWCDPAWSLLQHHSSKASIFWHSAFFTVQLSHPYVTTGKIIALTRRNFVGKVVSLLFNILSRLLITVLPRSKCLLISWLQSPSAQKESLPLFPLSPHLFPMKWWSQMPWS